jgi:hypothetical protein
MAIPNQKPPGPGAQETRAWLDIVREQVGSLEYGVVQITVHNARVTQIDRTERTRLTSPGPISFATQPDNWRD